ncbi:MAG TPA: hypothetical protein VNO52_15475, partial [Methylomirabilota bacterium]|nr:hypothetical protein [Methylomirabilota bacterium]
RWRRNGSTFVSNGVNGHTDFMRVTNVVSSNRWDVIVYNLARPSGQQSAFASVKPDPDTDGDGIPDSQEAALGLNPNDPADANVDGDGDGMTNKEEAIAGTNPTDAASYFKVDRIAATNRTVIQFSGMANRTYTVQYTDAPGDPAGWRPLVSLAARSNNFVHTIEDSPPRNVSRIYRLTTPAQP